MKKIKLTKDKFSLVDDSDFEWLNGFKWMFFSSGYAVRFDKGVYIPMHRFIMKTPKGMFTDHINGNPLDNRRSNLRICTAGENRLNMCIPKNNTSGYKGVCKFKYSKSLPWTARININKKRFHLGYFKNPEDAAVAYNEAAIKYHGQFARLNNL